MPSQDYPDLKLSKDKERAIISFLSSEISRAKKGRKAFEKEWKEIRDLYDKTEMDKDSWGPFEGSAKLMLPVMATYTETMFARAFTTIWGFKDPFTAVPLRKEFVDHVRPLRSFMTWATFEELDLKRKSRGPLSELFELGTCVSKTIYAREDYAYQEWDETLGEYIDRIETWKDSPDTVPVSLDDFYFPMEARNEDEMYWKSHRLRMTWNDLKRREASGKYLKVDRIKDRPDKPDELEQDRLNRLELSNTSGVDKYDIHEVWFEYIIDDELGLPIKLVAFFHPDSETLLRIQPNWFPYQLDPFDMAQLIYRKNSPYGRGVGHMALPFQKELSAMHNQRLDQGTLANSNMIIRKANSRIQSPIRIKPGGEITVDEMNEVEVVPLGRNFTSGIQDERHTISFLEQRLGWQEYQMSEQIQAQTATTTVSAMQEKMRRFDLIIDGIREFLSSVMTKSLLLYQKYYPQGKAYMLMGEDGMYIEDILHVQDLNFIDGVGIRTTATTSTVSKELERQAKLSVFNLLSQYYVQVEQRFIAAQNPQIPPPVKSVLMAIVVGLSEFVLEILEDFDIRISDRLVINFQELRDAAMQQAETLPVQGDAAFGGMGPVPEASGNGASAPANGAPQGQNTGGVPAGAG